MSRSQKTLKEHFEHIAESDAFARKIQQGFHRQLRGYYKFHVQEGLRVLEFGCAHGDLLASLRPSFGLGVDISEKMIGSAQGKHDCSQVAFRVGEIMDFAGEEAFDVIILDYLIGYLPDVHDAIGHLHTLCHERTRVHLTTLNHMWEPLLKMARWLKLATPQPASNWLSMADLKNILELNGFEVVQAGTEQLFPFAWPLISPFCNRFLARCPFFRHLGMTVAMVARPICAPKLSGKVACSVVVPARNESGNIRAALERIPVLGRQTEVIFVEGNSTDDTWEVIQKEAAAYKGPHRVRYIQQPGQGKWDAVYAGFQIAEGDVLVIQDGDLTAPPEDLPKFFDAIISGRCEFANGCRLVYPMETQAMRFLNLLGNKFFAATLSFVLGQTIKDSLCGTKMMLRSDYERLLKRIEILGDFDPFGDFNLLYGSAMLDLRIRDILVRYRDRTYGDTNISRFRHGWILLKMTWFGLRKIRFFSLNERESSQ